MFIDCFLDCAFDVGALMLLFLKSEELVIR